MIYKNKNNNKKKQKKTSHEPATQGNGWVIVCFPEMLTNQPTSDSIPFPLPPMLPLSFLIIPLLFFTVFPGLPRWCSGKESTCKCRRFRRPGFKSLGWEAPLEKGMATYCISLAWRIPWMSLEGYGPWGCKELDVI